MKKILAAVLMLVALTGMTACLEEDSSSTKKDSQKVEDNTFSAIELPEDKFD